MAAGARNRRNRLALPSRWISSDRRASSPVNPSHGNWVGMDSISWGNQHRPGFSPPAQLGQFLREPAAVETQPARPSSICRTAVWNLERAGVPRSTAMKMVGHKTESIYRRYAIVDEAMLKEGAAKLQTLHEAQAPAAPVIPPTKATRTKRVSSSTVRVNRGGARDRTGRRTLSPCRRARKQWWAGTGLNRRHQDFQT